MLMQGAQRVPVLGIGWGIVVLAFILSCSGLTEKERYVKLQRSVERYASDIRWNRLDAALNYIARKEPGDSPVDPTRLEGFRVTGYELGAGRLAEDSTEASVVVTFTYYDTDSGRLRSLSDLQHWWFNDSLGRWFLDGDLPKFVPEGHESN